MTRDDRREIGEILALLAHDLKNPLAAVLTNLGFIGSVLQDLDEGVQSERGDGASGSGLRDARDAVVDARLACDSMQRFVTNLELVAREAAGRTSLAPHDPTPLDLRALAEEIVGRQQEVAQGRRLNVVVRARDRAYARADRDMIVRALDNVLANALQHAPPGSEVVVGVGVRGEDESQIEVHDEGPIVPAEMREIVATSTGQVLAKVRPELRYGRGLGLYAASLAALVGGGRLEFGEANGRSVISVVVPRHDDA